MGNHTAFCEVGDLNLMPIGNIDKDSSSGFLELKRLGMCIDCNFPGLLTYGI